VQVAGRVRPFGDDLGRGAGVLTGRQLVPRRPESTAGGQVPVLLAEANVPYPQLKEMDEINPEFARADVALVIGANDVTNPAARRPGNEISGMPILDVDQAKSIIVIKRSTRHGYAGIDNELYTNPKTVLFLDVGST
jgi:NAD/NADP transhydrogenase beta subunit